MSIPEVRISIVCECGQAMTSHWEDLGLNVGGPNIVLRVGPCDKCRRSAVDKYHRALVAKAVNADVLAELEQLRRRRPLFSPDLGDDPPS